MSVFAEIHEASKKFSNLRLRLDRERVDNGEEQVLDFDGTEVRLLPFYCDHRSTRQRVMIDSAEFACEIEVHHWSILKPTTLHYWVWLSKPRQAVRDLLESVGLPVNCEMEEFYEEEGAPVHYNASVEELEHVLLLWHATRKKL